MFGREKSQFKEEWSTDGTEDTEKRIWNQRECLRIFSYLSFPFCVLSAFCGKTAFPLAFSCAFSWPTRFYFAATAGSASHRLSARIGNIVPL